MPGRYSVKKRLEQGKGNLVREYEKLQRADVTLVSASLRERIDHFRDCLEGLKHLGEDIPSWASSTLDTQKAEFFKAHEELEEAVQPALEALDAALEHKQKLNSQKLAAGRMAVATRERVIKPYVSKGSPGVLIRWIYKEGALVAPQLEAERVEESQELLQAEVATWHTANLAVDAPEFDRCTMALWSPFGLHG